MLLPAVMVTRPSLDDVFEKKDGVTNGEKEVPGSQDNHKDPAVETQSTDDSSPDSVELARRIPDRPVVGARKSKSLGDMLSFTRGSYLNLHTTVFSNPVGHFQKSNTQESYTLIETMNTSILI